MSEAEIKQNAPGDEVEQSLYAKREKIYPREVHGLFAALRTSGVLALLGFYYIIPWLMWDGHQAVLFDLPAPLGLERAWRDFDRGERSRRESRFEQEKLAFHEAVRKGYLQLAQREPQRFHVIDAAADPETVARQALQTLAQVMRLPAP